MMSRPPGVRPFHESARPGGFATRGAPMPDSLAEADPIMQRFQEAPYDELASAAGGGRLIGLGLVTPGVQAWLRLVGYVLSLFLLAILVNSVDTLVSSLRVGSSGAISISLLGLLAGIAGGLLLWKLIRSRNAGEESPRMSD